MKNLINLRASTYQDLTDKNTVVWDWENCTFCANITPHHFKLSGHVCEVCNTIK